MFSDLTDIQKSYIWEAIKFAIASNSGIGFLNKDQGHPAYVDGSHADGEWGDSPDQNELFKMVSVLDEQFREEGQPKLSTWKGFCRYAYEAYKKAHL